MLQEKELEEAVSTCANAPANQLPDDETWKTFLNQSPDYSSNNLTAAGKGDSKQPIQATSTKDPSKDAPTTVVVSLKRDRPAEPKNSTTQKEQFKAGGLARIVTKVGSMVAVVAHPDDQRPPERCFWVARVLQELPKTGQLSVRWFERRESGVYLPSSHFDKIWEENVVYWFPALDEESRIPGDLAMQIVEAVRESDLVIAKAERGYKRPVKKYY